MKKILLLIFGLLVFASGAQTALAAGPDISIPSGWITPPNSASIGTDVIIKFQVQNTPANAAKIELWISDVNHDSKKDDWPAADGTFTYTWKTEPAQSIAGTHTIAIKEVDAAGVNVGDVYHHSYILTQAGSPGDPGEPGTPAGEGVIFDAGRLGKVEFIPTKINDIGELAVVVINWLIGLLGGLAVIALIYSGIMYITAGADETKAETAKKNLLWALTGIIVTLLSLVIVNWVSNLGKGIF